MEQTHLAPTLDAQLFDELYGVQPQAIIWLRPIRSINDNSIVDFEYTYSNAEGLHYLNMTRSEMAGYRISNIPALKEPLRKAILDELIHVFQTGEKSETIVHNEALNKYARVLRAKLRGGVLNIVQDITRENRIISELEEKNRQIEEQKNLLDNILFHSSNGITVGEAVRNEAGIIIDFRTRLANEAAVELTGLPKEIYLSKSGGELDPNFIHSPYFQQCLETLETGKPFITQYHLATSNRWLEVTVSKMDEEHIIHIFTDVTPIKETQLNMEKTVAELRRSNENLEEFTRAASHDLKEPMRKVQFFTERLKASLEGRLSADEEQILQRVENAGYRMNLLVDDLLSYAQLNSGTQGIEEINLNEKIRLILSDLELVVTEKKAIINVGELPTVKGHRRQLQQLFQNLISNSLKYTEPGVRPVVQIRSSEVSGATSGIEVSPEDKAKHYHLIEVQDNGIGFEQEYAERIFQVFTRLHGLQEYAGTGVGLAIVKKVVENHRGYISAEGKPGEGALFRVLLPA